jgi:hypothetical protein
MVTFAPEGIARLGCNVITIVLADDIDERIDAFTHVAPVPRTWPAMAIAAGTRVPVDEICGVTGTCWHAAFVTLMVTTVSELFGTVCPAMMVSTRVPDDCVHEPTEPKTAAFAPPTTILALSSVRVPVRP